VSVRRTAERLAMHGLQGLLYAAFAVPMFAALALVAFVTLYVSAAVSALVTGYVFGP
jgi:hypothetical protein